MKLLRPLLAHQSIAFDFAMSHPNPFFAMAMRTGKTLTTIRYCRAKYPDGKFLVVAPLTVLIPWMGELAKEGLIPHCMLASDKDIFKAPKSPGWYLVGKDALRVNSYVLGQDWDVIAVDESTLMRNPKAEITKALNNANVSSRERILLSGWPCPEGDEDWFEQMRFVGHGMFMGHTNFYGWRRMYFRQVGYDWIPRPGSSALIKNALEKHVFFLSAAQAGMPDRFVEEVRYVKMHPDQTEIYEQVEKDFAATYEEHALQTKWVPVRDTRLHQIASGECPWDDGTRTRFDHKLTELAELLTGELSRERVVVFFRFDDGVNYVADRLKHLGIHAARVTGDVSLDERASAIQGFQEGRYRVILVQADCGRYALDLSCSSTAVFYSQGYSFETWAQCRQRLKHPSKSSSNLLIYLVTRETLEEHILEALRDKKSVGDYYFTKILKNLKGSNPR